MEQLPSPHPFSFFLLFRESTLGTRGFKVALYLNSYKKVWSRQKQDSYNQPGELIRRVGDLLTGE